MRTSAPIFGIATVANVLDQQPFRQVDTDVIAFWTALSSMAGRKAANTQAVLRTARHYDQSESGIYTQIAEFRLGLRDALIGICHDPEQVELFCSQVYEDRGANQRLRFEAAIALAAAHAQVLGLITTELGNDLAFIRGPRFPNLNGAHSILLTEDRFTQTQLVRLAQSLVAAAHAAMTGFLRATGASESLCRALSQKSTDSMFRDYHPVSSWLAQVGLSWLPYVCRNEVLAAHMKKLRGLGYQTIASSYRQIIAYRRERREQARYLSQAKRFALKARQCNIKGGVSAPFVETFDVLENPDHFQSLPWKKENLGLTEALEVANAGILSTHFREADQVLESIADKIPPWHLPVRSRSARLEFACDLALGKRHQRSRDLAHELCALLPHDYHMLKWVERTKGELRRLYRG
ncbi:MAG: hypothetical protein ACJ8C4_09835 [Gemmataceae bacterium]